MTDPLAYYWYVESLAERLGTTPHALYVWLRRHPEVPTQWTPYGQRVLLSALKSYKAPIGHVAALVQS